MGILHPPLVRNLAPILAHDGQIDDVTLLGHEFNVGEVSKLPFP
jgi:hypothetical protein